MRLTGLYAGREALVTEGAAISAVADNLANMNTTAFKEQRPEFADLLADSVGSLYGSDLDSGNGAQIQEMRVIHDKQGTFDFTNRSLDVGIDGKGHFLLSNGDDQYYTRAGNFTISKTGELTTEDGLNVLGFTTASPDSPVVLSTAGITGVASASTTASLGGNLNTGAAIQALPAGTSFQEISSAADLVSPITIVDSLGQEHDVSMYFFHVSPLVYTVQAYVDGAEVGGTAGAPSLVGSATIQYDGTGQQPENSAVTMNIAATWSNQSAPANVNVDLSALTGFASPSALSQATVDGNRAGSPVGYEVEKNGTFNVLLDTGDRVQIGTIAVSDVQNLSGLEKVGDNRYRAGSEAGEIVTGVPAAEGRGELVGGALESSTVDPAGEFVDLIRYQRAYQAGSQIITTVSELLNVTLQLA